MGQGTGVLIRSNTGGHGERILVSINTRETLFIDHDDFEYLEYLGILMQDDQVDDKHNR